MVIDHHLSNNNQEISEYSKDKDTIKYIESDSKTATGLVLDITAHLNDGQTYKNRLSLLSDISRIADGFENIDEHEFRTSIEEKYDIGADDFRKLSRLMTHIANEGYENYKNELFDFLVKNIENIKKHITDFDEGINYDAIIERLANKHNPSIPTMIVEAVYSNDIPNSNHTIGILAEDISRTTGTQSVIVHSNDDKSNKKHKMSVRGGIPDFLVDFIDSSKKLGEVVRFGGREGAYGGSLTETQFNRLMKMTKDEKYNQSETFSTLTL